MLTFKEFNDYIKKIREQLEYSDNLDDALRKMSPDFGGFFNTAIDIAIDLLKRVMNDKDEWIEYYIYEANWGKTFKEVYESDGTPIPLETIEDLYNIIIDSNKEQ